MLINNLELIQRYNICKELPSFTKEVYVKALYNLIEELHDKLILKQLLNSKDLMDKVYNLYTFLDNYFDSQSKITQDFEYYLENLYSTITGILNINFN